MKAGPFRSPSLLVRRTNEKPAGTKSWGTRPAATPCIGASCALTRVEVDISQRNPQSRGVVHWHVQGWFGCVVPLGVIRGDVTPYGAMGTDM